MEPYTVEDAEQSVFALYFSRGDLDAGDMGLVLNALRKSTPAKSHPNVDIANCGKWFAYLRGEDLYGRPAIEVAHEMFRKFATYEDGIAWLHQSREGESGSRIEAIKSNSSVAAIIELRKMPSRTAA